MISRLFIANSGGRTIEEKEDFDWIKNEGQRMWGNKGQSFDLSDGFPSGLLLKEIKIGIRWFGEELVGGEESGGQR